MYFIYLLPVPETVLGRLKGGHWRASGRSQGQKRQKTICPWDVATELKSRPSGVSGIAVCYLGSDAFRGLFETLQNPSNHYSSETNSFIYSLQ